jgi:transposase
MAGRFEGLSDLEWHLLAASFPPGPMQRGRGLPQTPFRKVVKTLRYGLITSCRGCDLPRGPPWASQRAAPRGRQRWPADGTLAARPARLRGLAAEHGLIPWPYGAIDGACSPGHRWRCGRRPRQARPGEPAPESHRGRWPAVSRLPDAGPWERGRARHAAARRRAHQNRPTRPTASTSEGPCGSQR